MAGGSLALAPGQTGAPPNQRKRKGKAPAPAAAVEDEAEAEELESEVADLDRRILEHLRRAATRLPTLPSPASPRSARPHASSLSKTTKKEELEHNRGPHPRSLHEVPVVSEIIAEDDQELDEKVKILKSKIKANMADLPKVLEQINEIVARCEKFC